MTSHSPDSLSATRKDSALDGLRGVAALLVFVSHFLLAFYPGGFTHYFPWVADAGHVRSTVEKLLALPVVSVLWSGAFPVMIFFVLSGYVLTAIPSNRQVLATIRSRTIRRIPRLCIPIFCAVMLAYGLVCIFHGYPSAVSRSTGSAWLAPNWNFSPTLAGALQHGAYGALIAGESPYINALWTMRMELIGSLLIFSLRILEAPGTAKWIFRAVFMAILMAYFPREWPFYGCFLFGYVLGGIRGQRHAEAAIVAAVAGIVIASVEPGARPLQWLPWPPDVSVNFFRAVGAVIFFYGIRSGTFDSALNSRPMQFLGKISFPLYLLHIPIIFSVSCWVYLQMDIALVPHYLKTLAAGAAATVILVPLCVLFERWVDQPAISLSAKLSRLLMPENDSGARMRHQPQVD